MFKKCAIVLSALICVSCLMNVYAKQTDAEKLAQIDGKISEYQSEISTGKTLFWVGLGADLLSFAFIPSTTYTVDSNFNLQAHDSGNSAIFYILCLGGSVAAMYGGWEWYDASQGLKMWETKRMDVSLGVFSSPSIVYKNINEVRLTAKF